MADAKDSMIEALADRLAIVICKANDQAIESLLDRNADGAEWWDTFIETLLCSDEASVAHQARWRKDSHFEAARQRVREFLKAELRARRRQ